MKVFFMVTILLLMPLSVLAENSYNWVRPPGNVTYNITYTNVTVGGNPFDQSLNTTDDVQFHTAVITPADGTADPLFSVETTGVNQYGWDVGTYDLTGFGVGKYSKITPRSNGGLIGDGLMLFESALIVGDSTVPGLLGQSIGFMQTSVSPLNSVTICPTWDYDGLGNHKMNFQAGLIEFSNNLSVLGTFIPTGGLKLGNGAHLTFTGQNGYDPFFEVFWAGGNYELSLVMSDQSTTYYFGNSLAVPSGIEKSGSPFNYFKWTDDASYGTQIGNYPSVGMNSDYSAYTLSHGGTNIPSTAFFLTLQNMANEGTIFQVGTRGDTYIGASNGDSDYDVALKFRGMNNNGTIIYDQSLSELNISSDINSTNIKKDLFVEGNISAPLNTTFGGFIADRVTASDNNCQEACARSGRACMFGMDEAVNWQFQNCTYTGYSTGDSCLCTGI